MASVHEYAALQLSTLDGMEAAACDADASLARAERHAEAVATVKPAPRPTDRAAWGAYVADLVDLAEYPAFTGAEVIATHARQTSKGTKNRLPGAWGVLRLLYVLSYAQALRARVGAPLRLNSLYRDPAYNRAIGGASLSQHIAAAAADLGPGAGTSVTELHRAAEAVQGVRLGLSPTVQEAINKLFLDMGTTGAFSGPAHRVPCNVRALSATTRAITLIGGIGRYRSFVHVDLRGSRSRWQG